MAKRVRLGILTPSSNTSLEPLTQAIVAGLPGVTVHFSRFTVLKISLDGDGLAQFQTAKIVEAARLLADARVDMIGWSGTSAGWLGFATDEKLCAAITDATGVPATTSVLALNEVFRMGTGARLGMVTPYTDDVQQAITANYATIGVDCTTESHLGLTTNTDFGDVDEATLDRLVRAVATAPAKVDAISTFCTNLYAAQRVAHWEATYGVPVYDTVSTVVWAMLRECGVDMAPAAEAWGQIFKMK